MITKIMGNMWEEGANGPEGKSSWKKIIFKRMKP
jgi:hypothetical protein